jgi:hypothetical protein
LYGLSKGEDITTTFCKVSGVQPDLDLGAFLQRMIHEGILVDVLV